MEKNIQYQDYEVVIGLEIHAQLQTRSKLFSGDSTVFGASPNSQTSAITLAHPGTLPRMNKEAISLAVKMGLACNCDIESYNYFARKNYFYPDLPKGYQVSQHTTPICKGGFVTIKTASDSKQIQLNRIHLEEDAGKSIHDIDAANTSIDYNRAGTPLIELVTEPVLSSADEAFAFVTEIRKMVRYLNVCDGNMEEGSLRCDANISVRKIGDPNLGTRVEVKNLNSIRNVKKAIEIEAKRLIEILETGGTIIQQTLSFDASNDSTLAIRDKEDAEDYRYFPEPDLTAFDLSESFIESIKATIPVLPAERVKKYVSDFSLSEYDAEILADEKSFSDYFELLAGQSQKFKASANWMTGPVKNWLNEKGRTIEEFPVKAERIADIIKLIEDGKLSFSNASSAVFTELVENPHLDPLEIAERLNLIQDSSLDTINEWVDVVLQKFPEKVLEYKKGKKGLIGLFVGEVKKLSKGKADPKVCTELLTEKLNK
jgi:aspartyl-tRNA(Asn)/glutamyl-tRNA(Gln) amidotransferase subunit B